MSAKKVFLINGSPRKTWNTAKMCESFAAGVKSAKVETEIVNLYDLDFKGCHSCFSCKLKGGKNFNRCAYPDALTPILDQVIQADGIVFATPIYFLDVSGVMREFLERLLFPFTQYDANHSSSAPKRPLCATIYTMNITEKFMHDAPYGQMINKSIDTFECFIAHILTPPVRIYAFDTYQFSDYSKYAAEVFNVEHKVEQRDVQFPKDLQKAFDEGINMATKILA